EFLAMDLLRFFEMIVMDYPNIVSLVAVKDQEHFMDVYSVLEQGLAHFYIFREASPLEYRLNIKNGIKKIYDMVLNQELIYKVKSYNEKLVSDVAQKDQKLEVMNQEKNRYLNFLIHELKGPLSSAKGFLELLLGTELTREEEENFLALTVFNTEEMLRMINCLLDYARSEEYGIELSKKRVALIKSFQKMEASFGIIARNKKLELKIEYPDKGWMVNLDPEKFEMALSNVVTNAIKYTDKGWVKISARKESEGYLLEVADTGRGIEEEEVEHIFEAYQRGRRTNDIQGTGLGLAFTRKIIDAHQGTINVKSPGAGQGSLFRIYIPF
ncbi:MAG: hypothetical protein CVV50_03445, partial [Spirochaetae bacterium HGW-Spirochaetae-6]